MAEKTAKTIEEKLERIWDGLQFHMLDLAEFLKENEKDPWFDTDEGKEMKERSVKILAEHTLGMMTWMIKNLKNKK
jgi:hypothetical protein